MTDTPLAVPAGSKRLVVVRHSKTEPWSTTDHARVLTDRGRRDARDLGRWLHGIRVIPEVVLVSSAMRARETAELMVETLGGAPTITVLSELYAAGPDDVLVQCATVAGDVTCAAVVGHNPTMAMLADLLLAEEGQVSHFPTSATAVIDVPGTWASLPFDSGTLVRLNTPRG
jgi:phosphohistidine phosphatase